MDLKELYNITQSLKSTEIMPVLFVGHGSPMNAIEKNDFSDNWTEIGKALTKPTAILCISAHWETKGTQITAMQHPETIHDFGGFPKALFDVEYPAPGDPTLALEIQQILKNSVTQNTDWGLDHGSWSVLKHIYPAADVPVLELSLDYTKSPLFHYNLAKELAPLRRKGVLIVGSGNLVHNLRLVRYNETLGFNEEYAYDWALEMNQLFKEKIKSHDHKALIQFESLNSSVKLAIPTAEHYLPLLYALALQEENEEVTLFNDKILAGSLSMTSVIVNKDTSLFYDRFNLP